MPRISYALVGCLLVTGAIVRGDDPPTSEPRAVPLTRPEMKQFLEDLKTRRRRIPLPELTAEDKERLGERADSYESRLRYHYMPAGSDTGFGGARNTTGGNNRPAGFDFTRNSDPNMTLDYAFKTMLFWIVSRTNNCHYCLGHQEQKLSAAGLTEEQIAALDFSWERYTPAQQAAFAFARKVTYEPHRITDADIGALRKHYTDLQILEMTTSVSGNNSINRWKEGAGIPQSKTGENFFRRAATDIPKDRPLPNESFLTPTPGEFTKTTSKVAAFKPDSSSGKSTASANAGRPALESRAEVEAALEAARHRKPRLPLVSEGEARTVVAEFWPEGALPQWVRLLANFPVEGKSRIRGQKTADETGDLSPLLKAQVSWIIARQDRAWYAVGQAQKRLRDLGQTDDQIFRLDGDWQEFTPAERSQFNLARKLASTPIILTDDEVAVALKETSPRDVVQLISYVTGRAYFDRVTEVAGLAVEQN